MPQIALTQGQFAKVDEGDLKRIALHRWHIVRVTGGLVYAATTLNGKRVYMHRFILKTKSDEYVDHINHDGLDNRRSNLRIVSQSINLANARRQQNNRTGFRGVVHYRRGWKAQVKYQQQLVQSNQILDKKRAALLRDEMARQLFGPSIFLNFPDEREEWAIEEAKRLIKNQIK